MDTAQLAAGDPTAWISLLMQGGMLPWLLAFVYGGAKVAKWVKPLVESYLAAHIEMTKQVVATQSEITTLLRSVDMRLGNLERRNYTTPMPSPDQ